MLQGKSPNISQATYYQELPHHKVMLEDLGWCTHEKKWDYIVRCIFYANKLIWRSAKTLNPIWKAASLQWNVRCLHLSQLVQTHTCKDVNLLVTVRSSSRVWSSSPLVWLYACCRLSSCELADPRPCSPSRTSFSSRLTWNGNCRRKFTCIFCQWGIKAVDGDCLLAMQHYNSG